MCGWSRTSWISASIPRRRSTRRGAFPTGGCSSSKTGYSDAVAAALADRGHKVVRRAAPLGGAQAVLIDAERGVLIGVSDPRKDGCALGL